MCDGREQRPKGRGGESGLSIFLEEISKWMDGDKKASRKTGGFGECLGQTEKAAAIQCPCFWAAAGREEAVWWQQRRSNCSWDFLQTHHLPPFLLLGSHFLPSRENSGCRPVNMCNTANAAGSIPWCLVEHTLWA